MNLKIASYLAGELRAMGVDARMTRTGDTYLRLQERTELANRWKADMFVSILPVVLIFVIMYFLIIRPQRAQLK